MRSVLSAFRQGMRSRLIPVCLILFLQMAASRGLSIPERRVPPPDLRGLPVRLGAWEQRGEQALDPNTVAYLRPDEYILRDYVNDRSGASINLFVAYFKSLQGKYGPHSPRVCLPGAGWSVRSSRTASVSGIEGSQTTPVNEYIMEKSGNRILVVFWYQNERDAWADEFWAKIRLLPDLIRYHRSDASLVRLISPTADNGNDFGNCLQFIDVLAPALTNRFEMAR
ncbi:MAG TPA: EpsI family protein [Bryobacteraceae bacterium]|nr:EpsI family protein [Bryobacteraceae bacterium]